MPEGIDLVPMKNILSYEEIELIAQAAAEIGIRKLKITGGEPLVRLGCAELIGRLKAIPGIEQVTLTSNGVLLKKYLPALIENGLDAVNISLDTLDAKRYQIITGQDKLQEVLDSLQAALDAGLRVKINSVLQRGFNEDEWLRLARMTLEHPLDVRFIEMMPIGYGKDYETVYNEDIVDRLREFYPTLFADDTVHGNGPAVYFKIPHAQGSVGFISAMHGKFCNHCNRLRVTSQGKIKPCLCFGDSIDLASILKKDGEQNLSQEQKKEEIKEALLAAIRMKPENHKFEDLGEITEEKKMIEIGG
jgi:cyclic pyranopterin phosphate synthase